jgi:hypothetical protein
MKNGWKMHVNTKLDNRLMRAMREGVSALPGDLGELRGYLRIIDGLLAEKAAELEPSWEQACAAAAEISTLQTLEATVAERAIAVRADCLEAVRAKLAIWRALAPGAEDGDMRSPRNRLILSIEADLERLSSAPRR